VVPIEDPRKDTGRRPDEGPRDPGDPREQREPPSDQEVLDELARDILQIHEESYGKGAATPLAILQGDWVVVVLDGLELLPNEKFMIENGQGDTVKQVRSQYQVAIQSTFTAAVERATGRTVIGFTSATSIEDNFSVEIFKLR
jgi:uncharacterized protein YbcI